MDCTYVVDYVSTFGQEGVTWWGGTYYPTKEAAQRGIYDKFIALLKKHADRYDDCSFSKSENKIEIRIGDKHAEWELKRYKED